MDGEITAYKSETKNTWIFKGQCSSDFFADKGKLFSIEPGMCNNSLGLAGWPCMTHVTSQLLNFLHLSKGDNNLYLQMLLWRWNEKTWVKCLVLGTKCWLALITISVPFSSYMIWWLSCWWNTYAKLYWILALVGLHRLFIRPRFSSGRIEMKCPILSFPFRKNWCFHWSNHFWGCQKWGGPFDVIGLLSAFHGLCPSTGWPFSPRKGRAVATMANLDVLLSFWRVA